MPDDEQISYSNNRGDIDTPAINSALGVSARSAILLCNRLLKNDRPLPELLPFLLHHFARDQATYARLPILQGLPFLMSKSPDLGWRLLGNIFQDPQYYLWKYAERCFYHQYQSKFDKVSPYLDRLMQEAMEDAGDAWGRISTLASLSGHISQKALFDSLAKANPSAWKGVAQVFASNLNLYEHKQVCHSGLITILGHENLPDEVAQEIEKCFDIETNAGVVPHDLALAFINALSPSTGRHSIHDFLEWLGYEARRNPISALEIAEILVDRFEVKMRSHQIWNTEPLITALNEILREADESDDSKLIQRAIALQDHFLKLDIRGIEEFLGKAGYN